MSLFQEGYKLYYRQMVVQLRINKEICICHNFFPLFCPSPANYTQNTSYKLFAQCFYLFIIARTCFGLCYWPSSGSLLVCRCVQLMFQLIFSHLLLNQLAALVFKTLHTSKQATSSLKMANNKGRNMTGQ